MTPRLLRWLTPWLLKAGAVIGAAIGLLLYIQHVDHAARREQREADRHAVELAQNRAKAADLERALADERGRATITENRNDDLPAELADARARAAAYLQRVRGEADQGGGERADLPPPSDTAAIAGGSDPAAFVSGADFDICIENTVRLGNAQRWYRDQLEVKQ